MDDPSEPNLLAAGDLLSKLDRILLARADFWVFIEHVFSVLHPGHQLIYAQYLELLVHVLMEIKDGKRRRLIVNLPPRHMKSMLISVMYVAWRLGLDPTAKFICISYGEKLAQDLSTMCRKLMMSPQYAEIFPNTVLDKKAADHIVTTKGGSRFATAVGSDITGFGANEIIIDDPQEPDQAASESAKEKVRSWVQSSVMTRFNDPSKGALILVMHRLTPNDLSATLATTGDYYALKLPLIAEEHENFVDANGEILMERDVGDILNPGRMTLADVAEIRAGVAPHTFNSQFQQRPTAGGSGMLAIEKFRRYERGKEPPFELFVHSWDIGATVTGNASVCTNWGVTKDNNCDVFYLLDVVTLQLQLPEVVDAIKARDRLDKPAFVLVDERGVGLGAFQSLRKAGYRHVFPGGGSQDPLNLGNSDIRPNSSKIDRMGAAIFLIADGLVFLPDKAPWLERFIYEIASFPNIADKDQVDSMTQFLAYTRKCLMWARQRHRPAWLGPPAGYASNKPDDARLKKSGPNRRMIGDPPTGRTWR